MNCIINNSRLCYNPWNALEFYGNSVEMLFERLRNMLIFCEKCERNVKGMY